MCILNNQHKSIFRLGFDPIDCKSSFLLEMNSLLLQSSYDFPYLLLLSKHCSSYLSKALGQFGCKLLSLSFSSHLIDGKGHIETAAPSFTMPLLVLKEIRSFTIDNLQYFKYIFIRNESQNLQFHLINILIQRLFSISFKSFQKFAFDLLFETTHPSISI